MEEKYKFGKDYNSIVKNVPTHKTSASLDMCIFERNCKKYTRILNIEFKHKKIENKNIGKDILNLLRESQDGAFIHLLDNTNRGTFCNKNKTGILICFTTPFWILSQVGIIKIIIHLIILSLEQKKNKPLNPILIPRKLRKSDLDKINSIFYAEKDCINITEIDEREWRRENLIR